MALAMGVLVLAVIGSAWTVSASQGMKAARERAKKLRPRMHWVVTCFPCACGWWTALYASAAASAAVTLGDGWETYYALSLAPQAGVGIGTIAALLGGSGG